MNKTQFKRSTVAASVGLACAVMSPAALAFKLNMENGLEATFDSTISFGMQKRLQSPNMSMVSRDNGGTAPLAGDPRLHNFVTGYANPDFNYTQVDDGNLNYGKGDIVSMVVKGTHEFFIKDPGNWSALARATWSSDLRADHTDRTPLHHDAERAMERNVSLLDLWVAKDFSWGDNSGKVKLGNQVISWGEDVFIIGGVNSINALDLRKWHIPGTQLKEIFVPAPMLSLSTSLGKGVSFEGYYQFKWNKLILDPAGTYWSGADFLGKGNKRGAFIPTSVLNDFGVAAPSGTFGDFDPTRGRTMAYLTGSGTVIPVETDKAKNNGQYGMSLRLKPENGDTEWGLYYIRYHDKLPFVGFGAFCAGGAAGCNASPLNLIYSKAVEQYGENKSLYGVSMNTKLGDWAIGAELTYRPRDSVAIDPTVPFAGKYSLFEAAVGANGGQVFLDGYRNEKKYQAHLTGFYLMPPEVSRFFGAAESFFLGEVAVTHYPGLDLSGRVPYLLNNYTLPDKTSWGYVAEFGLTYANIFDSGWTMSPLIDFFHDVKGTAPNTLPFVEGRKALNIGLNFDYHNQWKANISYTTFFGGGNLNLLRDRDVLGASLSYTF